MDSIVAAQFIEASKSSKDWELRVVQDTYVFAFDDTKGIGIILLDDQMVTVHEGKTFIFAIEKALHNSGGFTLKSNEAASGIWSYGEGAESFNRLEAAMKAFIQRYSVA